MCTLKQLIWEVEVSDEETHRKNEWSDAVSSVDVNWEAGVPATIIEDGCNDASNDWNSRNYFNRKLGILLIINKWIYLTNHSNVSHNDGSNLEVENEEEIVER